MSFDPWQDAAPDQRDAAPDWPDAEADWDTASDIGTYGPSDDEDAPDREFSDPADEDALDANDAVSAVPVHAGRDIDQSRHTRTVGGDAYEAHRDVYVTHNYASVAAEVRALVRHRHTSAPDLAAQTRLFLPPDGLDDQIATLATTRVLVLLCSAQVRRCGQRAAAAYLVHRIGSRLQAPHGVSFQQPILDAELQLDQALAEDRDIGLFFDLADAELPDAEERLRQFGLLERRLSAADAYAVIAVADDLEEHVAKWFPGRFHRLARRSAEDVFRVHTRDLPQPFVEQLLSDERMRAMLIPAWPPQATRMAKITARIYRSGTNTAPAVVAELGDVLSDWSEQIRKDLAKYSTAPARALLLATALLEGSGAAAVVRARNLLLSVARYQPEPVNSLEAPGVVTELASLTDVKLDPVEARFSRPEYGAALMHHVWREHPALHGALRRWFDLVPSSIDSRLLPDIGGLTERIVALADRDRDGRIAISIARRWSMPSAGGGTGDRRRREAAVRLLTRASLHERLGPRVRGWLYSGAYDQTASVHLRSVMADVAGQFGTAYPGMAMTRLKHLAAGPEPQVISAVEAAIAQIAVSLSLSELLEYLTGWLTNAGPVRADVVVDVVLHVLNGRRATDPMSRTDRATATRFWRTTMDVLPADRTAALVRAWLLPATGEEGDGPAVGVLLDAAGGDLRRMGQLLYATRSSSGGVGEGDPLADLFAEVRIRLDELTPMTTDLADSRRKD